MNAVFSPPFISLLGAVSVMLLYQGWQRRSIQQARKSAFQQRWEAFQRQSKLAHIDMEEVHAEERDSEDKWLRRVGLWLQEQAFRRGGEAGASFMESLEEQMALAGHPRGWHATELVGYAAVLIGAAVILGGLLVQAGSLSPPLYLLLVLLAANEPRRFLRSHQTRRQEQAAAELPYFLDELILALSSGSTNLDNAIRAVVFNPSASEHDKNRVLVQEFRRAYLEQANLSRSPEDAYRAASRRIGVPQIDDVVELLLEGLSSGAPILHMLEETSVHVYTLFEHQMQTLIKKKDTPFTVATILIMCGTAVLIVTPILLTVFRALAEGASVPGSSPL